MKNNIKYDIAINNQSNDSIHVSITAKNCYQSRSCHVNIVNNINPERDNIKQAIILLYNKRIEPSYRIAVTHGKTQLLKDIRDALLQNEVPCDQMSSGDYLFSFENCNVVFICYIEITLGNQKFTASAANDVDGRFQVLYDDYQHAKQILQNNGIAINDFMNKLLDIYDKLRNIYFSQQSQRNLADVEFMEGDIDGVYYAKVKFENEEYCDSFRIHYNDENSIALYKESDDGKLRCINDPWLLKQIKDQFKSTYADQNIAQYSKQESCNSEEEKTKRNRTKNAKAAGLLFYRPHQMLREIHLNKGSKRRYIIDLAYLGDVHPCDLSILAWVNEFRYITNESLLDLVEAGLIAPIEPDFSKEMLDNKLKNLYKYGLLDISRFVTLNDKEEVIKEHGNTSVALVYTLGDNGQKLLFGIGRHNALYNVFERFQDGNIVKAILAANQWLVYWLYAFPKEFENKYHTSQVIYLHDQQKTGARFHAAVECNDTIIVGAPLRRTAEEQKEQANNALIDRFKRFMVLFDDKNKDILYSGFDKITLPSKKIICYICEDEEHIREIHSTLELILSCDDYLKEKYKSQEIWFTTDLKTHNYNEEGKRFIVFNKETGTQEYVDLKESLGLGRERASWDDTVADTTVESVAEDLVADDTKYIPKPIDTSEVNLNSDINELIEKLAANTHDVWAAQRIAQGWSYGPERNDNLKQTPCLLPYDELPEEEKEYDRKTATEALKVIVKLGFDITKK